MSSLTQRTKVIALLLWVSILRDVGKAAVFSESKKGTGLIDTQKRRRRDKSGNGRNGFGRSEKGKSTKQREEH